MMLTVDEVLAKYDRPIWAQALCIRTSYGLNDMSPYYWVGCGYYKRVTSKHQRWELDSYGTPELQIERCFEKIQFQTDFFEELRHATQLEF